MVPYPKFVQFVKQVFSLTVRRTRLENLQLLTYGLLRGHSCCLSRIARSSPCLPSTPIGCAGSGDSSQTRTSFQSKSTPS